MKKAKPVISALASIILLPISVCSIAQVVDVSGCRAIEDRLQRFDCYEALGEAETVSKPEVPSQSTSIQPRPANSRPAVAQSVESEPTAPQAASVAPGNRAIEQFGTTAAADNAELIEGKDGKTELVDTVAKVEQRLPTLALITLESGQKWLQVINKRYPLKAGDEVRIYPTSFGKAYRLTVPRISGFIQVERIK